MEKLYTAKQIAANIGVHQGTIKRWTREGVIKKFLKTPGGHYRYPESIIEEIRPRRKTDTEVIQLKIPHDRKKHLEKKLRKKLGKKLSLEEGILIALTRWVEESEKK